MARNRETKIELTAYDDLFQTDESRAEAALSKIRDIPISGDVSMRDITFQNGTGFPINRVEKIGYIRSLLEQAEAELPPEEKAEAPAALSADRHNFRITDDTLGVGGAKEKFRNNMAAINLLHELEIENRLATPEEQEILSRYVGWGGLSMAFDEHNAAWADEFKELYASLSPEEYNAAMESTLTAFYTPPVVIKAMYEALDRLGFSQGNILEPSCGTGNFFGLLPESMAGSKLHGVELDPLTGKIAKQLYQKGNIAINFVVPAAHRTEKTNGIPSWTVKLPMAINAIINSIMVLGVNELRLA